MFSFSLFIIFEGELGGRGVLPVMDTTSMDYKHSGSHYFQPSETRSGLIVRQGSLVKVRIFSLL